MNIEKIVKDALLTRGFGYQQVSPRSKDLYFTIPHGADKITVIIEFIYPKSTKQGGVKVASGIQINIWSDRKYASGLFHEVQTYVRILNSRGRFGHFEFKKNPGVVIMWDFMPKSKVTKQGFIKTLELLVDLYKGLSFGLLGIEAGMDAQNAFDLVISMA
jgi:hypothetical protein